MHSKHLFPLDPVKGSSLEWEVMVFQYWLRVADTHQFTNEKSRFNNIPTWVEQKTGMYSVQFSAQKVRQCYRCERDCQTNTFYIFFTYLTWPAFYCYVISLKAKSTFFSSSFQLSQASLRGKEAKVWTRFLLQRGSVSLCTVPLETAGLTAG